MRALTVGDFATAPELRQVREPEPSSGQVKLRIRACGLNFADLLMAKGTYQDTPEPPFTLGMEVAGDVVSLGDAVEELAIGDRVAVFCGSGGLAEFGCFDADRCIPLPEPITFEQAAAFQVSYGTSHLALTHRARLSLGERLVVTGAAGGVGLTAVELGAQMGAEVIAVARGKDKLEIAKRAGAIHLIDPACDNVRLAIKALGLVSEGVV